MGNGHHLEQPLVSFQVITDTHVRDQADHIYNRHLEKALADITSYAKDSSGIMHVGDVTDRGLPEEYQELQRILDTQRDALPEIRYTVGNHDIGAILWQDPPLNLTTMTPYEVGEVLGHPERMSEGNNTTGDAPITTEGIWQKRLNDFTATTGMKGSYHDHWIHGYHYIFLGSEQPHPKDCDMSAEQLAWLETTLSEQASPDRPIFVFLHQPLMDTVAGSMKDQGWYGVNQDAEVKSVLSRYPQVILFSGHTHWQLEAPRTMVEAGGQLPTMFNAASVAYLWTDEDERLEGSQGLQVDVYADRVVVKGRNYVTGTWIEGAEYTIPYPVKVKVDM
ncbi:metallophosphoesterase family protein [Paenibacillus xylanilyticus]|uniref:Metallophosphoesterase n=1 Tax=Paenibacillus xylanilyticus TaxID=248903 RepID=A0A7Y6EW14_9BACL|nr:metallophosphoesterase [Paenibacillus xylanilyticus]NUU77321.1 metallophosphoesterase [Paenibacillus xylanilyticus]